MGYRPTKRAGGNAGGQVYHSFNREIPRRAGESPGPACDSRNLLKHEDIWIRRRCPLADKARGKSVSVRGDEAKRPDAYDGNEVDLDVEGHGISAKLGGISHPAPVYDQGPALDYVSFGCRQGPCEGYLLACHRRAGGERDQEHCC